MLKKLHFLVAAGLIAVLAGCAVPPTNMGGYRSVDEVTGLPVLRLARFDGVTPARAQYADLLIREEYARYDAGGARAELFYITPRHETLEYVALNHRHDSSNVADLFNYMTSRPTSSTPGVGTENEFADFWFRIFSVPGDNRQCVVFNAEWDLHGEDALLRPDKVMFGYYCPPPGETLDKAAAIKVVDALGVRDINVKFTGDSRAIGAPAAPAVERKLMELATGTGAGGNWGAAGFPFDMAAPYEPSRSDPWN